MLFTSLDYFFFFAAFFVLYWLLRARRLQNSALLLGSYLFYGWIHPWFCILIAFSTLVDYTVGLAMERKPEHRKKLLIASLIANLGMLATFKYFNFFVGSVLHVVEYMGFEPNVRLWQIVLPVGISFYTFQTLSYTIDIYRGQIKARTNFIDFAVFVSFFPQLVAGPIERAKRFLPQIEKNRKWEWHYLSDGVGLISVGLLKKMVIADNIAVYVDKIFMLQQPSWILLAAGTGAFALQIYTDFAAYTDLARGSAKLLGFDLVVNFRNPYMAISPSDFWRRWHISFSSWIRDYLYISLGGSRVDSSARFFTVVMITMGLSGLWHGAAWHFVAWGLFHGILVFAYHKLGMGGRWMPKNKASHVVAWLLMFGFTMFGWMLFRAPSLSWLWQLSLHAQLYTVDHLIVAASVVAFAILYSLPLLMLEGLKLLPARYAWLKYLCYGLSIVLTVIFFQAEGLDFIYFQF